jgi:A/G-specific adenine glycosylase
MAQQTQASRAAEAWQGFMTRFPTPAALAATTPAEVLRAWRGLGYNRRAINLQRAASAIVERHGGRVPDDLEALEALPGVGPYTARAVAALAFGQPVGAVDTNVRRVLSRLVGASPGSLPAGVVQGLADTLVDPRRPGDWTHAAMDVGARLCRASRIDCEACPLRSWCRTAADGAHPSDRASRERPSTGRDRRAAIREGRSSFRSSSRWLRGRIVDRLRDAPAGAWVRFDGPLGDHPPEAVSTALDALAVDGLIERRVGDDRAARLPTRPAIRLRSDEPHPAGCDQPAPARR